ncbi:hypothetical protein E2C01_067132 [Portunus trituberculatus]|uniref:Uncharacterized protein n=1 Tax=Portunus trituberculatus TaxID=210409 RepID=A0A5B7HVR5_PORTR|nr:hypothetical protein [Portunus trituberculatus]
MLFGKPLLERDAPSRRLREIHGGLISLQSQFAHRSLKFSTKCLRYPASFLPLLLLPCHILGTW